MKQEDLLPPIVRDLVAKVANTNNDDYVRENACRTLEAIVAASGVAVREFKRGLGKNDKQKRRSHYFRDRGV